jgi:hypothetical protein
MSFDNYYYHEDFNFYDLEDKVILRGMKCYGFTIW